jgi:sugar O-acyltransferase (sialic acid O-acetyltransferase NeuD family)
MKKILIIGCGGFGRELWTWLDEREVFFYSDIKSDPQYVFENQVLNPDNIKKYKNEIDCFYIAISDPKVKKNIFNRFNQDFILGPPIIKSTSYSSKNKICDGTVICPGTILTTNISIGKSVIVNINCTIGHDSFIGDWSTVSPGSFISGNVNIGNEVRIGTGSCIREKIMIGDNATVGMGSTVVKDVKENTVVFGTAAKEKV